MDSSVRTRVGAIFWTSALLLGPLLGGLTTSHAASASLCTKVEKTLFSCRISGKRVASVCAHNLSAEGGFVQYRFGRTGVSDLRVPPSALDDWRAVTSSGMLTYSGGGAAYLAFSRPPFRYVIYDGIGRGWGTKSGVAVEESGKRIANFKCLGKASTELGPDLFQQGGFPQDKSDFELP